LVEILDLRMLVDLKKGGFSLFSTLKISNPISISKNREYGGLIHENLDGPYSYTQPTHNDKQHLNIDTLLLFLPCLHALDCILYSTGFHNKG
jgi:hypothetical protein